MTRDDIIRIARSAGLVGLEQGGILENFQRFAALVTAEKDKEIERLREALHDISISQNSMYQEARAKQALGEDQNIWRMCGVNTDDVIKMADEAGIVMSLTDDRVTLNKLNRFLELHLKALKNDGYRKCAEGQRTTQYCGLLDAAVKAEREACELTVDSLIASGSVSEVQQRYNWAYMHARDAIRARGRSNHDE